VFRRTTPILLLVALMMAFAVPASHARTLNVYERMVVEFIKTQKLDACNYSTGDLKKAKAQIPVDQSQYGAALIAAIDDAIAARAQGACDKKKVPAPSVADQSAAPPPAAAQQAPPSSGTPQSATPQSATPGTGAPAPAQAPPTPAAEPSPAASIAADDSISLASDSTQVANDAPFPVLILAILAALLALCATAFGFVRWFAWEPAWMVRLGHSTGEAGSRASSTFSEFADFVRLGR